MDRPEIGVVIHTRLFAQLFTPADRARLDALGAVRYTDSPTPISVAQACALLADCDIGLGSWQTPYPNAELMAACPRLKLWEHAAGSVKHMFGPHLEGSYLLIGSCKTAIADSVAEFTLGQILLGLRRVFENIAANRSAITPKPANLKVLFGSTIGIVGASEVGKRVIRLLRPFGSTLLLYDPFVSPAQAEAMGVTRTETLEALCAQSDVVSLHAPELPATRHLMGAREFQAMKDDAIFINTARGGCVDEAALIAEAEKGRLLAFLDVTQPEPPALDSPLRTLPNILYTSHIAGPPTANIGKQAVDDIAAFLQGGRPLCIVTADQLDHTA